MFFTVQFLKCDYVNGVKTVREEKIQRKRLTKSPFVFDFCVNISHTNEKNKHDA